MAEQAKDKVVDMHPKGADNNGGDGKVPATDQEGAAGYPIMPPFDPNLPYDRDRIQWEILMLSGGRRILKKEIGLRLKFMWEQERGPRCAKFAHFLNKFFPNMEPRRAYEDMQFAEYAQKSPLFQEFAKGKGNKAKALFLIGAATLEDMENFENTGVLLGITFDELDSLTFQQLKKRVKEAEEKQAKAVQEATEKLEKEIGELRSDKEALEAALNGADVDAAFKVIRKAEEKFLDAVGLLRQVPPAALEREAGVRNLVFGSCEMLRRLIDQLEGEAQAALNRALAAEESEE